MLELTVKHLRKLKHQNALGLTPQATYAGRFRAGYSHCAQEVSKFMSQQGSVSIESTTSARLLSHLANCLHTLEAMPPSVVSMAISPLGGPSSISSPVLNVSYPHQVMSSPFATSSPRSCTLTPSSAVSPNSFETPTSQVSFIREKPLDLIKEKENHEAQDLSLSGTKQRFPLSTKSPSDSNIKRRKSSSPPVSAVTSTASKDDSISSWRPW